MINYQKHITELETLGFTIVENVFSAEIINDLKQYLDIALEDDQKKFGNLAGKKTDLAVDLSIHHPFFLQCLDNDIIFDICTEVLDKSFILYSYTSTVLRPNTKSGVHEMHIDSNKFIANYITGLVLTVALDDFTEENGATLYLAGSQNLKNQPSDETFNKYSQLTVRKAGDVLFFNPRVWHKAGNNITNQVRYGMTIYATRSFFKQRFDFPRMIPKKSLEGLSTRMLSFLGFNSIVPDSVENYYLPYHLRSYFNKIKSERNQLLNFMLKDPI